jgi:membrane protein DedA with SNARE-associated domain
MALMASLAGLAGTFVTRARDVGVLAAMTLESVGVPLPSEVVMPLGGALAPTPAALAWTVAAGTVGNVLGSALAYAIGRAGGARWLQPRHLAAAERWFARRGAAAVFVGRLLPVVRTYISFPAGSARMPLPRFLAYTLAGSLLWAAALAYAGYRLRADWRSLATAIEHLTPWVALAVLLGLGAWAARALRAARARPHP